VSPISPPDSRKPRQGRIRTFVAVDLPEAVRVRLGEQIDRLSGRAGRGVVRWVRPEGIHLTLKFLGEVESDRIEQISRGIRSVAQGHRAFRLRVAGVGCFPSPQRPRVVWVGVREQAGALASLQDDLERALSAMGFPREDRPFSPHLTLGRVRREASPVEAARVGALIAGQTEEVLGEVEVREVTLFQSDLRPTGPIYSALAVAVLGAAGE
jgi:2'-5' RNA ligase